MKPGRGGFLGCLVTFVDLSPVLVLVKAGLSAQLGPSHMHPGLAETATNCGLLVAQTGTQGQSQTVSDISLQQSPSQ